MSSSPHLRGCFRRRSSWPGSRREFPASAGVFPDRSSYRRTRRGVPRICGGVSAHELEANCGLGSSPHLRGCFWRPRLSHDVRQEFPASAGVFLSDTPTCTFLGGVPRICGGVSKRSTPSSRSPTSFPHLRGCFYNRRPQSGARTEFPASAGVFLTRSPRFGTFEGVPRICGGVSAEPSATVEDETSSPHLRGCFSDQ